MLYDMEMNGSMNDKAISLRKYCLVYQSPAAMKLKDRIGK